MAAAQAAPALAADALCCLGLGFLLGALYDLARFLLGDRRAACFAADMGAFCLAAVLLCSFSASRSRAGTVRWYMAAALLAGDAGYFGVLAPATRTLENWLRWLLTRPVALLALAVGWPVRHMAECVHRAHHEKKQKKAQARRTKQLQKNAKVLYNSK